MTRDRPCLSTLVQICLSASFQNRVSPYIHSNLVMNEIDTYNMTSPYSRFTPQGCDHSILTAITTNRETMKGQSHFPIRLVLYLVTHKCLPAHLIDMYKQATSQLLIIQTPLYMGITYEQQNLKEANKPLNPTSDKAMDIDSKRGQGRNRIKERRKLNAHEHEITLHRGLYARTRRNVRWDREDKEIVRKCTGCVFLCVCV